MTNHTAAGEDGFTLAELMVVVVLSGIVLGVAADALIQSQRTVADTFQRQSDLGEARIAADAVSADLRTLVPLGGTFLQTAAAREVTFYALRDVPDGEGPVRIRLVLEADGDLVRHSTRPPAGSGTAPDPSVYDGAGATTVQRVLARGVRTENTMFRYYASYSMVPVAGAAPTASPSADPLPLVAPSPSGPPSVTTADRSRVRFIEVTVEVQPEGARDVGTTRVEQVVRLPNL